MTVEMGVVFAIVAVALYLFASQKLPLYVTAMAIMVTVTLVPFLDELPWLRGTGVDFDAAFPTVSEGLSGLSNTATVTVLAMFILSAGIQRAGLLHVLGRKLVPFIGTSEVRLLVVVTGIVGVVSGFVNNTAAVAVSIPFVLEISRSLGIRASKVLMPLSFMGMLGGMLTVIGTSTSILAASLLADMPAFDRRLGLFEFAPVGLLVLLTGMTYFLAVGRFLLPNTDLGGAGEDHDEEFVVEARIPSGSGWSGTTLEESGAHAEVGVTVLALLRGEDRHRAEEAEQVPVQDGDILTVRGTTRQVADLIATEDVDVVADMGGDRQPRASNGFLVRALVRNRWLFNGQRAGSLNFPRRYRARLVGLETERPRATRLADERLRVGEVVLLEAEEDELPRLRKHPDLVLLSEFEDEYDTRRMWLCGLIMLAVVAAAALTPVPIVLTALAGVVVMAVTGCVTKEDVTSGVPWDIIFMLAGVIPLGIAMTKSGAAQWIGDFFAVVAGGWPPLVVLIALYLLTTVLTEVVSNNASVVILIPVAAALSAGLDIPLIALALTVMFAASTSFLSPVGYQTNAMVFGTGVYRFTDFAKVGGPLNLILTGVTCTAIWFLWIR
ncbi:SLC13 family permease [Ruania alba]|uniref:TrkA-C domain-containing protein n=1 Tax=Ruania alba TaxID=648782 RepID=A0A1H5KVU4_9MICO|nr:SLC13 family permease [Ruania alba]SEE68972.1 TrkA-C domain-containing protein [Ruania alba]